ncbi:MAG: hypothetical protein ACYCPS_01380 [Candidatus Saccharimonadales bacterium]
MDNKLDQDITIEEISAVLPVSVVLRDSHNTPAMSAARLGRSYQFSCPKNIIWAEQKTLKLVQKPKVSNSGDSN